MGKTSIEWTRADDGTPGRTWNPVRGCSKQSPGCKNCYALGMAVRFSGEGRWAHGYAERRNGVAFWTGKVDMVPEHIDDPFTWRRPTRCFVNSMSDLFHPALPGDIIATVFAVAVAAHHLRGHTFQILSKCSSRARDLLRTQAFWDQVNSEAEANVLERTDPDDRRSDDARATLGEYGPDVPPPGIWIGASVEDQQRADERIPALLETPAVVRFLSCEPLLGPVNLHRWTLGNEIARPAECACSHGHGFTRCPHTGSVATKCHVEGCACPGFRRASDGLDWVICGGESGHEARPMHPAWARSIRDQCSRAGVPFFFKQWGAWGDFTDAAPVQGREDRVFLPNGEVVGAGHGSYGGMVDENWRERGGAWMSKVGKGAAGRTLDGRTWDEFPVVGGP